MTPGDVYRISSCNDNQTFTVMDLKGNAITLGGGAGNFSITFYSMPLAASGAISLTSANVTTNTITLSATSTYASTGGYVVFSGNVPTGLTAGTIYQISNCDDYQTLTLRNPTTDAAVSITGGTGGSFTITFCLDNPLVTCTVSSLVTHDFYGLLRFPSDGNSVGATRAYHNYTTTTIEVEFTNGTIQRITNPHSLVGWWKLDDAGGTTASNSGSAGSALNGTLEGSVTWSSGYIQGGINDISSQFSTNMVDVPQNTSNAVNIGTGAFTVSAWVKLDPSVTLNNTDYTCYPILSNGSLYQNAPTFNLDVYGGGYNGLFFLVGNLQGGNCSSICANEINVNATLSDHNWHLVTATRDANGVGILYLDGVEVGRGTGMTQSVTSPSSPTDIWIGQGDWTETFDGNLDDARIYTRAISPVEIEGLYNVQSVSLATTDSQASELGNTGTFSVSRTSPTISAIDQLAWWKLDDTSITTAANSSSYGSALNGTFEKSTVNVSSGADPNVVVAADLNGDGKMDLIDSDMAGNCITVHLGNGDGTFQTGVSYATTQYPGGLVVGDFNGDGRLDIAVTGMVSNVVSIFLGNGDGTFRSPVNYSVGSEPTFVAEGDFNGDGKLDLAVADYNGGGITILKGNGDGTFATGTFYSTGSGSYPVTVAAGDVNGDGKLDLVTANSGTGNVSVFLGNGDGTFQTPVNYAAGTTPYQADIADFNNDGHPDIVTANDGSANVSYLQNNGNGTFATAVNYAVGNGPSSLDVADLNGDGNLDIVTANLADNTVSVLLGNGAGGFATQQTYAVGSEPDTVIAANIYGLGKRNLVTCNFGGGLSIVSLPDWSTGQINGASDPQCRRPPVPRRALEHGPELRQRSVHPLGLGQAHQLRCRRLLHRHAARRRWHVLLHLRPGRQQQRAFAGPVAELARVLYQRFLQRDPDARQRQLAPGDRDSRHQRQHLALRGRRAGGQRLGRGRGRGQLQRLPDRRKQRRLFQRVDRQRPGILQGARRGGSGGHVQSQQSAASGPLHDDGHGDQRRFLLAAFGRRDDPRRPDLRNHHGRPRGFGLQQRPDGHRQSLIRRRQCDTVQRHREHQRHGHVHQRRQRNGPVEVRRDQRHDGVRLLGQRAQRHPQRRGDLDHGRTQRRSEAGRFHRVHHHGPQHRDEFWHGPVHDLGVGPVGFGQHLLSAAG